jgi:NADH-quinone oxidoreductase subunit G
MATVYVNNQPVDIGNERLNLIQAAQKGGVFIPYYCWHPALSVVASCRMCLVEVGEKKPDGSVSMQPRVVPACQTPAKDGTVVVTNSDRAKFAEQQSLESLLLNHPLDCPVCDKAGECLLQDYSYRFGRATSRMIDEKNTPPNKPDLGPHIALFTDRCIMCSRCVRFTREISGTAELQVTSRGHHSEIDIFPGKPLDNKLAGNVVDLCPVGALCSKDFLYKQRVWFLKSQKTVCPDCSTGCSIWLDHNKDIVYRLRPRENPRAQGHFMCDEGRFDTEYINDRGRIELPHVGQAFQPAGREGTLESLPRTPFQPAGPGGSNGQVVSTWEKVLPAVRAELTEAALRSGSSVAAVLSPFLTCEEAYLLAKLIKGLSQYARLYLGWVPLVGEDDVYPKDSKGNPVGPARFTIRAEKCPNRRGVEAILKHFEGQVRPFEPVADAGELQALYVTAGYPPRLGTWLAEAPLAALQKVPLLVVQDLMPSPLSAAARFVLPAASYAEKDGTFVNHANLAQSIHWAVRPAQRLRTDGQIFLDLLGRRGLLQAAAIRKEMAQEVPFFAALADRDLGDHGVPLAG